MVMSVDYSISEIPMKSLSELHGMKFIIPSQQRGYKWTSTNIEELIRDFLDFIDKGDSKRVYCLQPLAIVSKEDGSFYVLDGQQRLTTLFLLHKVVCDEIPYSFEFERDESNEDDEVRNRWDLLQNLSGELDDTTIDTFFITNAYNAIRTEYSKLGNIQKNDIKKLLLADKHSPKSVQVIWYEVAESKSHETFRNLNSGKIPLSNTELIKSLFLNRVSGLKDGLRQQASALFEEMEQMMRNDSFWYMFNKEEQREGQSRLDFIFNLVAKCTEENYDIDPRWSFRNYFDKNAHAQSLEDKWQQVRHTFLRLKDMYENPYIYHYVGFLTYCGKKGATPKSLLASMRTKKISEFIKDLRGRISEILQRPHNLLREYSYDSKPEALRRLFLIYNIETILFRYEEINRNNELSLKQIFERFPFELLHKQSWDIEHIASKTDNDFSKPDDREQWLESIKADLGDEFVKIKCSQLEQKYNATKKKEDFDLLYKEIMTYCELSLKGSVIPDFDNDSPEGTYKKDKNQLGNLTLLDSHTNRSFHNSLFPRKRRIVLVAGGVESKEVEDNDIKRVFVPLCTRQCFTKSYRRGSSVNLNAWTQEDADAYYDDIESKLNNRYFS